MTLHEKLNVSNFIQGASEKAENLKGQNMQDVEQLSVFYLGKEVQGKNNELTNNLLLYESKDLTTHAVCLGMTGSGKTGLCISLLEEAAIDNILALIIDPKGDMTNLALQFPSLTAEEFLPWINVDDASKKGMSEEAFAY